MKSEVYKFLCNIRLNIIKDKPSINEQDKENLNHLKKVFKSPGYKDDLIVEDINRYIKKPVLSGNKLKK